MENWEKISGNECFGTEHILSIVLFKLVVKIHLQFYICVSSLFSFLVIAFTEFFVDCLTEQSFVFH